LDILENCFHPAIFIPELYSFMLSCAGS